MFAIPVTQTSRPLAVLLGGTGYARPSQRMPTVPALLKPPPTQSERTGSASELRAAGV